MLTVNNLDIRFGDKLLFNNVSVRINDNDRIGLVGVNGTGKSTLLKVISGVAETDPGVITRPKRLSVAYLPQEATALETGRTIYQEAENAFAEALVMQQDLDDVNRQLAAVDPDNSEFSKLLKQQGELQYRLERVDIFRVQSKIEKVLMGLGFSVEDFDSPSSSLRRIVTLLSLIVHNSETQQKTFTYVGSPSPCPPRSGTFFVLRMSCSR